jgi:DNA-binding NtrC family response regulator
MDPEPRARVLLVDDDPIVVQALGTRLSHIGYAVETATAPSPIVARIRAAEDWDVVLLDVGLPEISGIEVLRQLRASGALAAVIMLTGDDSAATATMCMRAGAFHYLTKPCLPIELAQVVESAARHAALRRRLLVAEPGAATATLIGESPAIARLRVAVDRVGPQPAAVLIQGESGTGKELVARALHAAGRRDRPFLALNCSAIPETLIDSELFGHVKGAFTGATIDRDGVFAEADGGTLFLDEIGDMPLHVQARLLRVLQEGEVRPIGGAEVRKVDVRVIAATHVDLAAAVATGRFREDLYYRLNVVTLRVPPLRERLEDVPLLVAHLLHKHCGAAAPAIAPAALEALTADPWPGNVRELENALLHALALGADGAIDRAALPPGIGARGPATARAPAPMPPPVLDEDGQLLSFSEAKRRINVGFERAYLRTVLERAEGSVSEAARLAGIDRTNLRRLLRRHGIKAEAYRRSVPPSRV